MPDVGEGLTEAEILKWYVKPGDTVTDGQMVCEVETAKAAVELPIPFDGVVRELFAAEGETVDVGRVIIAVDTGGGAGAAQPAATDEPDQPDQPAKPKRTPVLVGYGVTEGPSRRRRRKSVPPADPSAVKDAAQREMDGASSVDTGGLEGAPDTAVEPRPGPTGAGSTGGTSSTGGTGTAARPLAKPPVRKLARDLGIDLATVRPSGPHGTITRDDVRAAASGGTGEAGQVGQVGQVVSLGARERRVPVKGVRKATAEAMVASAFTAPHVTEFITFDMTATMALVAELKQDKAFEGRRVGPLLMAAKALLVAIRRNPEINATWDEAAQEIVYKDYVNLGIAAATPRGLIVPNVKDADRLTLPQLAAALDELVATAREGRTAPADMQGATITITNVGVFGVDTGTPILPPGEAAILALGAVKLMPWVHEGEVKPRQVTTLALSFDHRLIDGELGSRFLSDVAAILEQPTRLIAWS
ncbi:MAG: dihydrolipoamide acetyltransferase family protein [Frankiaceae bacterium]